MDKDFCELLYEATSVKDMLNRYCQLKSNSENPITQMKSCAWAKYNEYRHNTDVIAQQKELIIDCLPKQFKRVFPYLDFKEPSGRIKSLLSTSSKLDDIEAKFIFKLQLKFLEKRFGKTSEEDIAKYIKKLNSSSTLHNEFEQFLNSYNNEKDPFEKVKDFIAYRIIIKDTGKEDFSKPLYNVTNFTLHWFELNGFKFVPKSKLNQTGPLKYDETKYSIFIPEKSLIDENYQKYCKDYIICPKEDGYQSIHVTLFDPLTCHYFEIQFRTETMDFNTRTIARHDTYKQSKYSEQFKKNKEMLDFNKITNIPNFRYCEYPDAETGKILVGYSDNEGIIDCIPI